MGEGRGEGGFLFSQYCKVATVTPHWNFIIPGQVRPGGIALTVRVG